MRILALDLGTHTGWALRPEDGVTTSGTWHLASPKQISAQSKAGLSRCCDVRFSRLLDNIAGLLPLDVIAFEDVQFLTSQMQAQLWAGFRTVVTLFYPNKVQTILAVPVG